MRDGRDAGPGTAGPVSRAGDQKARCFESQRARAPGPKRQVPRCASDSTGLKSSPGPLRLVKNDPLHFGRGSGEAMPDDAATAAGLGAAALAGNHPGGPAWGPALRCAKSVHCVQSILVLNVVFGMPSGTRKMALRALIEWGEFRVII